MSLVASRPIEILINPKYKPIRECPRSDGSPFHVQIGCTALAITHIGLLRFPKESRHLIEQDLWFCWEDVNK